MPGKKKEPQKENIKKLRQEIAALKKTNAELAAQQQQFKNILHNVPDVVFQLNPLGFIRYVSPNVEKLCGYKPEELLGKYLKKTTPLAEVPKALDALKRVLGGETITGFEINQIDKSGNVFFMEINLTPVKKGRRIVAMEGVMRDVRERRKTEKALRKSEEKYRNIVEYTQDTVMITDADGIITYISPSCKKVLGHEPEDLIGKRPWIIHPDDLEAAKKVHFDALKGKSGSNLEYRIITKKRKTKWVSHSWKPILTKGKPEQIISVVHDITERKRMEQDLLREKDFSATILSTIPDGMDIVDEDSHIIYMNEAFIETFGKNSIGKKCYKVYKDNGKRCDNCPLNKPIKVGETKIAIIHGAAGGRIFEINHTGMKLANGKKAILEVFRDITRKMQYEEKLRLSDNILHEVGNLVIVTDTKGGITYCAPSVKKILGYEPAELLGSAWWKKTYPDKKASAKRKKQIQELIKRKAGVAEETHERKVRCKDGTEKWFLFQDTKSTGEFLIAVGHDITERKKAELIQNVSYQIAKAAERRITDISVLSEVIYKEINKVVDASYMHISLYNEKDNTISFPYVNNKRLTPQLKKTAYRERTFANGFTEYVIKTKKPLLVAKKEIKSFIRKNKIKTILSTKAANWLGIPLKSEGRIVGVLAVLSYDNTEAFKKNDLEFLQFISWQIARLLEKQQITDELMRSEEHYRSLTENSTDLVLVLDHEGTINYVSQSVKNLFGYVPSESTGRSIFDFMPAEDRRGAKVYFKSRITTPGIGEPKEFRLLRKKGSIRIIEATGNNLILDGEENQLIINARDITRRVKTEQELQQRNTELDTFVYKASHDLKGPLASIRGVLNLADKEIKDKSALQYLGMISKSTTRLDNILTELLEISTITQGTVQLQLLDIEKLVHETVESLQHAPYAENVRFKLNFCEKKEIYSDHKLLSSVLQNLIDNAMKYKNPEIGRSFVSVHVSEYEKGMKIKVKDNGQGIPKSMQKKVFEMFFRGTDNIEGTGLGLFIVSKAVEKLGGKIEMRSKPKKGTEFTVYLPN